MTKKKILVVGGAGYIGSHVAKELVRAGRSTVVFDNLTAGKKENVPAGADFILGDLRNFADIDRALQAEVDAVIYLAALKAAGESMTEPEKYAENNIGGAINLLNALVKNQVKKIIFSSTAAVYGEPRYLPIDEKHPTEPVNFYGFTKLAIEQLLNWYDQLKGIRFAALRYFNAVGYDVGQEVKSLEKNPNNLLPIVLEAVIGQRPEVEIFGVDYDTPDGSCLRDYIHVSDLAGAHLAALAYLDKEDKSLTVNLGSGRGLSVKEIIAAAQKISGVDFKVKIGPRRPGDPPKLWADSHRALALLGWQTRYSDLETIIKTMLWAYEQK